MKAFEFSKSSNELDFKDAADIQSWSYKYVAKSIELGIINGYKDNTFKPNKNVTRAEAAAILVKALNVAKK